MELSKSQKEVQEFAQKLYPDNIRHYRKIMYALYPQVVEKHFLNLKGYENSTPEDLEKGYQHIFKWKPKVAAVFYNHTITNQDLDLQTRLKFVEKIDKLELLYENPKDAERKLEHLSIVNLCSELKYIYEKNNSSNTQTNYHLMIRPPTIEEILLKEKRTQFVGILKYLKQEQNKMWDRIHEFMDNL